MCVCVVGGGGGGVKYLSFLKLLNYCMKTNNCFDC